MQITLIVVTSRQFYRESTVIVKSKLCKNTAQTFSYDFSLKKKKLTNRK